LVQHPATTISAAAAFSNGGGNKKVSFNNEDISLLDIKMGNISQAPPPHHSISLFQDFNNNDFKASNSIQETNHNTRNDDSELSPLMQSSIMDS
jgi:hypothetical protein